MRPGSGELPGLVDNSLIGAVVDMSNRTCLECGEVFQPEHPREAICSAACRDERRKRASREHARRNYTPTPPDHPEKVCEHCGETFKPYRSNNRFCGRLCQRRNREQRRYGEVREELRECSRCGDKSVERRPGIPVCDTCKVDKRDPVKAAAKERRRRFRTYGITEDDYNRMLAAQGHRCGICRTDTPGAKGWAIDHCHESDMVRGILCSACNSAIGLLKENPAVIERAAEYVREHTQIRLVV